MLQLNVRPALAAGCLSLLAAAPASADIGDYSLVRTFTLPAPGDDAGGNVLIDDLPDGRLLALDGTRTLVETAVGSGTFSPVGSVAGFSPGFGPSFLRVSPDGTRAAAGNNGSGDVTVFDLADPASATTFRGAGFDFDAAWTGTNGLAVTNSAGVQVLDVSAGTFTTVVTNVGDAAAGVTLDAAGNLYAGNGFDSAGNATGLIKSFAPSQWRAALTGGDAVNFSMSGTPVADLLSAASLGFDAQGNLFVGGGDFFGTTPDAGYAALVDDAAVGDVFVTANSPADVLRKFASPADTVTSFQPPIWTYNDATGELLLRYFGRGEVEVYAVPEPGTLALAGVGTLALLRRRRRVAAVAVAAGTTALAGSQASAQSVFDPNDFAVEVVESVGLSGSGLYNDPAATLGRPTLRFDENLNPNVTDLRRASLVAGAFNVGPDGEKLVTTVGQGASLTVRMGRPVEDDPMNPFGVDLIVFGNAFYTGVGGAFADDDTDLRGYTLSGTIFAEPTSVSVSPDGVTWYRYANGPFADAAFPTNSFLLDAATGTLGDGLSDPTRPVDPSLSSQIAGRTAADVVENLYQGSAGGTGFDLAESGFASISFVRVEGLSGLSGGEVDAFADVRAVPEPGAFGLVALAGAGLLARRRTRDSRAA